MKEDVKKLFDEWLKLHEEHKEKIGAVTKAMDEWVSANEEAVTAALVVDNDCDVVEKDEALDEFLSEYVDLIGAALGIELIDKKKEAMKRILGLEIPE